MSFRPQGEIPQSGASSAIEANASLDASMPGCLVAFLNTPAAAPSSGSCSTHFAAAGINKTCRPRHG